MFGPRNKDAEGETQENTTVVADTSSVRAADQPQLVRASASSIISPRRVAEPISSSSRRSSTPNDTAERTLKVGKGLKVAGEITSCDVLVVEGAVEAKLAEGKMLEITEAGQFRGSVEIENADIAGRFDGQLTVHGRLTVRSTGRISGALRYGELEVNAGGQIVGEIQVVGSQSQAYKAGNKLAAVLEEVEAEGDDQNQNTKESRRKSA
jgi:cytoskeletal protein CcmA (bactofilin family)